MILGQYSAGLYFQISAITAGVCILIMYSISQSEGHEKPFPHCWISAVADHYPEFILFRTATISGSVLTGLGWFTNYFYIKSIAFQKIINIRKYHPQITLILGLMGSFFLMGSTANIDTGKHNSSWHTHCAGLFFACTVLAQIFNTVLFCQLLSKKAVGKLMTYLKVGQVVLMLIQVFIGSTNNFFEKYEDPVEFNDYESVTDIIIEWTLTYTVLFGFLIMSFDVSNFKFIYENTKVEALNHTQQYNTQDFQNRRQPLTE